MNIREIRETMQLSRKQFAELIGVSWRTVEAWELGRRKCSEPTKRLIVEKYRGRFMK